jgi:hypothetical protein
VTHFFFVCPYPWTLKWRADFEETWRRLSASQGHDGNVAVRHVLSAEPFPDPEAP